LDKLSLLQEQKDN